MSSQLSETSRGVIRTAAEFAREQGSEFIETEHLLLSLLTEASEEVAPLLEHSSAVGQLQSALQERIGPAGEFVSRGRIPLSPITQQAVDYAAEQTAGDEESLVEPPQLLLGLIREERGLASKVLCESGYTCEVLRQRLLDLHPAATEEKAEADGPKMRLSAESRFTIPIADEPSKQPGNNGTQEGLVESLLEIEFDDGLTYRELENDARVYVPRHEGWVAKVKPNWEKMYCYRKFPGDDAFHLILNGEIYLERDDEKYCLTCALRQNLATQNRLYWQRLKRKKS